MTEGLEELLDKDADDGVERGAKGEMRRGINVPFENGFVASGIGVGRGNGKVIKSPGNCRSIIINCVGTVASWKLPVVLGERPSAFTPGSTCKRLRRTKIVEEFQIITRRRETCGILPKDLEYLPRWLPYRLPSQLGFPRKGQTNRGLDYQI